MTDPIDDSWGDLAAELGVETVKPPRPPEPPPMEEAAPEDQGAVLFSEEPLADAEEPPGDTEVIELGGTDEQKKRRRRRRRRRKDGEPEFASDAPEPADNGVTQPSELLRDIIKGWDVPSWDAIVAGLYRPGR